MNSVIQRFIPRYRLRTLFVATTLLCLLMGLASFVAGRALLALSVLMFFLIGVMCCLLLLNPFDNTIRLRYGLKTVFFVTTALCVVLGLASFEAGRQFLWLSLLFIGPIGLLYVLVAAVSWILGTPGERQRCSHPRAISVREAIGISHPSDAGKRTAD
ncbi:MAG TPA: hypothetical protein VGK58_14760 [Lacipirellulaceae bacterium]